jgi:hypothetical protein
LTRRGAVLGKQGFREVLEFARSNNQLGVWDIGDESTLLAVWDDELEAVVPLDEDQALPILATDQEISLQWRKHRGMSGKPGRLIIVDKARCKALLTQLQEGRV